MENKYKVRACALNGCYDIINLRATYAVDRAAKRQAEMNVQHGRFIHAGLQMAIYLSGYYFGQDGVPTVAYLGSALLLAAHILYSINHVLKLPDLESSSLTMTGEANSSFTTIKIRPEDFRIVSKFNKSGIIENVASSFHQKCGGDLTPANDVKYSLDN